MTTKALTELHVRNLKAESDRVTVYDASESGLSIRVSATGRKAWRYDYRSPKDGKRAMISLGTYPSISLKDAREAATAARKVIENGRDPRDKPEVGTLVSQLYKDRDTLVAQRLVDEKGKVVREGLRSRDEIDRRYRKYIAPLVGTVEVKDFRITHLNKVVDPILARAKDRTAGMVFADLQTLMNFAVSRGELEYNPIAKAEMLGSTGKERDRYLALWEIRLVWHNLPSLVAQSDHVPQIVKLCLLTGQRVGEVCAMMRDEFDLAEKVWTIPAAKTKNGDEHVVPLTSKALEIVEDAIEEAGKNGVLFPNDAGDTFDTDAVARTIGRLFHPSEGYPKGKLGQLGIEKWTPHDLRRTVSTHMSLADNKLDIPELYIGHVLNHRAEKRKTITRRVYNKNKFLAEKRAALEKWETFLMQVIAGAPA